MDLRAKDLRANAELKLSVWARFMGSRNNSWISIRYHEVLEALLIQTQVDYARENTRVFFTWEKPVDWSHELTYITIYELTYIFNRNFQVTVQELLQIELSRFSPRITPANYIRITKETFPDDMELEFMSQ